MGSEKAEVTRFFLGYFLRVHIAHLLRLMDVLVKSDWLEVTVGGRLIRQRIC